MFSEYSLIRMPSPPQKMTTFTCPTYHRVAAIRLSPCGILRGSGACRLSSGSSPSSRRTATPMQEAIFRREGRTYRPELLLQPSDVAAMVATSLALERTAEVTESPDDGAGGGHEHTAPHRDHQPRGPSHAQGSFRSASALST